jgi:hypothetical protein
MAQGGIPRMTQPTGGTNAGAGPTPIGATVPSPSSGARAWAPTVVNLVVLLIVEVAAFAALRMLFRRI